MHLCPPGLGHSVRQFHTYKHTQRHTDTGTHVHIEIDEWTVRQTKSTMSAFHDLRVEG